ncbi:hypothetical protein [Alkaliphilus oremlandii]|uniref:Lipoprotein n=1 Tax=Alkaliphilus oremlandii (strain OhILAs) TaxID=350688 RepID=A8MKN0_ALKOO|nr:hypothetical protein [Alkaliphilus oremlandii]ABW20362.1 hypothetical protein Clos_2831 [Alkaliphilus oremlandii OhILAs]
MKSKIICIFIILIILSTGCAAQHNFVDTNAEDMHELTRNIYFDYSTIIRNKRSSPQQIDNSMQPVLENYRKYVSESKLTEFENKLMENAEITVKNEWKRIKENKITHYLISEPINVNLLKEGYQINDRETFILIVRAMNKASDKYLYTHLFIYNTDEDKYEIVYADPYIIIDLQNIVKDKIETSDLDNYEWYNLETR